MPVTREDILAKFSAFGDLRDAAATAHTDTVAAHENVVSVTTVEQGLIDAATAHFDVATTQAKQQATDAEGAETAADSAEDTSFNELLDMITNFKNEQ